ncbi:MAG: hypothetical protein FWE76_01440 [Symbiobacteriaceae bacterium]|nr:hypothetical protein [Symbiobacteriaceae bacterium]
MMSFEEVGEALDEIAENLPVALYKELNGGIILLPEVKNHSESSDSNPLYVIGEYRYEPRALGRYIVIYYGSFRLAYGMHPPGRQRNELQRVLMHEFRHHIQSLGGTRGLEREDQQRLERFKRSKKE